MTPSTRADKSALPPGRTARPRRPTRAANWATYAVFSLATVHGLAAGSSTRETWALVL